MEQSNKELIREIADLFEDYEESYVPGEWEAFQKQRKKKYPFLPYWFKVAAILFLMVSVFAYNLNDVLLKAGKGSAVAQQELVKASGKTKNTAGRVAAANTSAKVTSSGFKPSIAISSDRMPAGENTREIPSENKIAANTTNTFAAAAENSVPASSGDKVINAADNKSIVLPFANPALAQNHSDAVQEAQVKKDTVSIQKRAKLSTSEFLLAESKKVERKESKKAAVSKWDFGLQVMPTATHTNMNFGGGLVTAYHISDKISVSSGITLMQLGSGENVPSSAPASASSVAYSMVRSSAESRQLLAVDASIKAIDIPLGLVYKVNKHYYTSAGISYFNVLSEKRNNTYSETVPVSKMSRDPSTGEVMSYSALETQQVDEETTDRPLKGNSYLGFFNFSIGRRQNIFKQYNIQIEPFIKVPIGKLSAQDLNLMNSGVKFQLSF